MEDYPPSAAPTLTPGSKLLAFMRGWKHRPLLTLGWVAVIAILITDSVAFLPGIGTGIGLVFALTLGIWKRRLWAWMPFVALTFATIHGWRLEQTYEHPLRRYLLTRAERPEVVRIKGRLYPWTEGAELDAARAFCKLSALSWGDAGNYQPTSVRVKVALPDGYKLEKAGVYEITGLISLPKQPMNPGQFDPVDYSLRNGWVAYVQAQTIEFKEAGWSPTFHLLYWAERSRQWITAALSLGIEDRKEDTAVLLAMALGASDAAGEEIEDAFRDSGTLHIFAVSGLHVVMLAVVLSLALRWLGLGKSRSVVLLIIIVFAYAYITGWRPSAARAAFMISVVMVAMHWNRKSDVQNSLGLALFVLLIWDSHQLFQPGFQLSFLVLWAICAFAAPMLIKLQPWTELDPFLPQSLASWTQFLGRWSRRQVAALACTSLAAWIGSLPLTLGHFHTVTPVGLLANLLLVPLSGISIGVSCVSLLAAGLGLGTLQVFVNWLNAWMARFMVVSAGWFAGLPGANVTLDLRFEKEPPPMEMQVFHLPGGGSAGHVRVVDKHWLIDTGNVRPWRSVIRPFFRHQGINTLEGVLLTHGDSSHVGAVPLALLMNSPRIITSLHEPWMLDSKLTSFQELNRRLEVDSLGWHRHQADDVIPISTGSITVLHPLRTDHYDKADDRGLVLMLSLGQTRVLWLGDAGFITEKRLLERGLDLRCDVMVRGQHPTDPGGLPEFFIAAQPGVVISANDSRHIEEMIPQRVRDHCTQRKIPHFDLEVSGSVKIGITNDGARLRAHRSGEEIFLPARPR